MPPIMNALRDQSCAVRNRHKIAIASRRALASRPIRNILEILIRGENLLYARI
jgi:hypothetical protein